MEQFRLGIKGHGSESQFKFQFSRIFKNGQDSQGSAKPGVSMCKRVTIYMFLFMFMRRWGWVLHIKQGCLKHDRLDVCMCACVWWRGTTMGQSSLVRLKERSVTPLQTPRWVMATVLHHSCQFLRSIYILTHSYRFTHRDDNTGPGCTTAFSILQFGKQNF